MKSIKVKQVKSIDVTFVKSDYKLVSSMMLYSLLDNKPKRILYIKPTEWER